MSEEKEFEQVESVSLFNLNRKAYLSSDTGMYYRHAKGPTERLKAMIAVVVVAGLFHQGWMAIKLFMRVLQGQEDDIELVLVHTTQVLILHDQCIAMGLISRGHVQVFVNKDFRRNGIGSSVLRFFHHQGSSFDYSMLGERGSKSFWNKNEVKVI